MARADGDTLKVGARVAAAQDLPGIPAGTAGRGILRNDMPTARSWTRYRVWFDTGATNGTDIGSLDRSQLIALTRKGQPVV